MKRLEACTQCTIDGVPCTVPKQYRHLLKDRKRMLALAEVFQACQLTSAPEPVLVPAGATNLAAPNQSTNRNTLRRKFADERKRNEKKRDLQQR